MMRINLVTLIVYFFYSIKTNEMNKFKGTMQCNAMQKKYFLDSRLATVCANYIAST